MIEFMNDYWLSVLVAVYLVGMTLYGHYRGFIRQTVSVAALVISIVAVNLASPYVKTFLLESEGVQTAVTKAVSFALDGTPSDWEQESQPSAQRAYIEELPLPEQIKSLLIENNNSEVYEMLGVDRFADYLAAYTDFYNGDYLQIGYIAVPQFLSEENMQAEIKNFSTVIVHIYLGIALLAILLTIVAGRRISAPLHTLERKLREMRIGRRNEKIDYRYHDEIGQLVAQYNRMVDELEQSVRLLAQSERESAWKSMARQVAHEINNPLTPMKLSIQQLQRRKDMADAGFDDYFRHTTAMLVEQIDNLSRIAATFSDFARMPEARPARVDVADTLQQAVRLFANNREQVDVRYAGTEQPVYVIADAKQLVQVFNNLIKNAIQSIPRDRRGQVTVSLSREGGRVLVAVTDNGSGVPPDAQEKLFTPNFTTKAQGMGLGLAISKKIVEQFGGTIAYDTQVGEGSTFRVALPPDVSR